MLVVRVSTLNRCYFIVAYSSAVWERWEVKSNVLDVGFVNIFGVLGLDLDGIRVLQSLCRSLQYQIQSLYFPLLNAA